MVATAGFRHVKTTILTESYSNSGLNGHEHYYARFRPMDPAGHYDPLARIDPGPRHTRVG
jgi:hypothetical protein